MLMERIDKILNQWDKIDESTKLSKSAKDNIRDIMMKPKKELINFNNSDIETKKVGNGVLFIFDEKFTNVTQIIVDMADEMGKTIDFTTKGGKTRLLVK